MYNLEGKVQKVLSNNETNFIVDSNCNVVCPWIIRNGATNLTEQGSVDNTQDPDNFGFFQKVFTGNECITATWENSTKLVKPLGVNAYDYQFSIGTYYAGAVVVGSGEYQSEIENMESMDDFLSMKTSADVTIRFESWVPNNQDMFKLYTLPDLYGKKWYYISNVRILNDLQFPTEDNTTSIPAVEVTFTSLVDKLQNTGRAVEQFVQYGAIGEPYTYPYVSNREVDMGGYTQPVKEISNIVQTPRHSRYLQLELFGANAISGFQVVGRKITQNANGTYRTSPWKFLLPINFYNGRANDINKTSLATKNFYYFPDETLVYRFSQQLWTSIKNTNDAIATNHNSGQISMGRFSNWDSVPNGLHKSNPLTGTAPDDMHMDYNNASWHPIVSNYTRSANGCYYCADTLSYTTSDTMLSILTKNGFLYSTQEVLPLGFYSSKPYKISNLPIIGGIISKWGGDWTIDARTKQRKPLSIGYFMDCDVAGMVANIFDHTQQAGQDDVIFGPTLALASGDKAPKWLGTTACNTTLLMELTDKIDTDKDTILLGQNKYEDGTWIDPTNHTTYLYNGQAPAYDLPTSENEFWFVIDNIDVYALHNGNIKITAFDTIQNKQSPIWQTTVKSKANWTNSIRDWMTSVKTGCWSDNWCVRQDDFTWPTDPTKPINPIIELNLSQDDSDAEMWNDVTGNLLISPLGSQTGFTYIYYKSQIGTFIKRNNYNPKTYSITYDQLGISGVTDRQSFLDIVNSINFNIKANVHIKAPYLGEIKDSVSYQKELSVNDLLSTSKYIVPYTIGLKNFAPEPYKKIETDKFNFVLTRGGLDIHSNLIVTPYLKLELDANTLTFTLTDNTTFCIEQEIDGTEELYFSSMGNIKKIAYSCTLLTAEFIKKPEQQIQLTGGSTKLIGTAGIAGSDVGKHWTATYGSTTLPTQLYNAPSGVTISGGTVLWDTTLTAGTYEFYVYATNGTKYAYQKVELTIVSGGATLTATIPSNRDISFGAMVRFRTTTLIEDLKINDTSILEYLKESNVDLTVTLVDGINNYTFVPQDKGKVEIVKQDPNIDPKATYTVRVDISIAGLTTSGTTTVKIN